MMSAEQVALENARLRDENETLKREVSRLKAELAVAKAAATTITRTFRPMGERSFKPRG